MAFLLNYSVYCIFESAYLSVFLSSCDELVTETILKSLQTYIGLCGGSNLTTPRDAIIIALCKASLPPQYALHMLTIGTDIRGMWC